MTLKTIFNAAARTLWKKGNKYRWFRDVAPTFPRTLFSAPCKKDPELLFEYQKFKSKHGKKTPPFPVLWWNSFTQPPQSRIRDAYGNVYIVQTDGSIRHEQRQFKTNR